MKYGSFIMLNFIAKKLGKKKTDPGI